MIKLYITKTDNHFGLNNSYEIAANSLPQALAEANNLVPFSIESTCLSDLENSGMYKQDLYVFNCHQS
jgi:hypothetical protein